MAFFIDAIGETPLIIDEVQGEQGIIFDFVLTDDFSGLSAVCMCVCVCWGSVVMEGKFLFLNFLVCVQDEKKKKNSWGRDRTLKKVHLLPFEMGAVLMVYRTIWTPAAFSQMIFFFRLFGLYNYTYM
jgi:hypothetical protein